MNALASLLLGLAAGDMGQDLWRLRRKTLLYVLLVLLALTGYCAGLLALGLFLAPHVGAAGAALLIAGAALVTLLVLGAATLASNGIARRRQTRNQRALVAEAALTLGPHLMRSDSPLSLIVAGGLGYVIADILRRPPPRH